MLQVTIRYRGSTLTFNIPTTEPLVPFSDLSLGLKGTDALLAEIGRRYEPRVLCVRGHSCRRHELNADGLCSRCLSDLGLS